jgi:flagellar hook-basal body complex protein FliE
MLPANCARKDNRPGFADHLKATFVNTNNMQFQAKTAMEELATGRNGNIHETLISMSKAETSFKMLMQVRNKVLNAYQEVQRMQF